MTEVAAAQRASRKTVPKWKTRLAESGSSGLPARAGPGRPSVIDGESVHRALKLTMGAVPHEATHSSVGMATCLARQLWQAADLKPHLLKTFKVSNPPLCQERSGDRGTD